MFHNNLISKVGIGLLSAIIPFGSTVFAEENIYSPPAGTPVHFNWGNGSPASGIPVDYFKGLFDQSKSFASGDYFVQTLADDGVKVEADGNWLINRWSDSGGEQNRALWLNVAEGNHTVKTHYYENTGGAAVFSDVVPFDTWLAYYYPNRNLSGLPSAAKLIQPQGELKKLSQDYGVNSPIAGVPADNFSARFTTAKRITAGEYILRTKADDGVRVFVDGELVLDRWSAAAYQEDSVKINISDQSGAKAGEENVHWIDVEYYEGAGNSKVEFFLEAYKQALDDSWLAEYYPNMNLSGKAVVVGGKNATAKLSMIDFNWGVGSPHPSIPVDSYSARFTKELILEDGVYQFETISDDGVRIWIDDQLIINNWNSSNSERKTAKVNLEQGKHVIKVEYYENAGGAKLSFNYKKYAELQEKAENGVHYNWGTGSPNSKIPADYFIAKFDQSKFFPKGDYFVQTLADDGIKVEADGNWLIDRWSDSGGDRNRALWLGVTEGNHTVKTHYYESTGGATAFSDVVPFDSWLAYFYPNSNLSGLPVAAKMINSEGNLKKLSQDYGLGAPAVGIPADNFSARYTTAKRITAGEYILRTKADDGVRVYVDGELVLDRWSAAAFQEDAVKINISDRTSANVSEKDVHWIDVEYYEGAGNSKVEFFLEPYGLAKDDSWLAEFYPNMNLTGKAAVVGGKNSATKLSTIDFNWGFGSPHRSIPADFYSARFTKDVALDEGMYLFETTSDDGVRVWVDDQLIINHWNSSNSEKNIAKVNLEQGNHVIKVEYYENAGGAKLSFNYKKYAELQEKAENGVHHNWGAGSPNSNMPADYFVAKFDQSKSFTRGDYFVQTVADDGIKVEADGEWLINRWSDSGGEQNRALWPNVTEGNHTVRTHYYENTGGAAVFSDVVPFDTWLAYYYPNRDLSGLPTAAKLIQPEGDLKKLSQDYGLGAPAVGIPADNFSARFTTAKRIAAGEYILRTKADDGVRVFVDGKLVLDRWTAGNFQEDAVKIQIADQANAKVGEENVHWIDVEYYDGANISKVEFFLESYEQAIQDNWIGEYYSNKNLEGIPLLIGGKSSTNQIQEINFNWGTSSPHTSIPVDQFSARYTKKVNFDKGTYLFTLQADDGVRVKVDNQLIIDSWSVGEAAIRKNALYLDGGMHTVTVEYYENTGLANLKFNYEKISTDNVFYQFSNQVFQNWGSAGPESLPTDRFEAYFDQSQTFNSGDYFIQTVADDRIKVQVDNDLKINRWSNSDGTMDTALLLNMTAGEHKVSTNYYEDTGQAFVSSHILPFDTWLAYYYPTTSIGKTPAAAKVISPTGVNKALVDNNGLDSPVQNVIPADNFSAVYRTAKRLAAGDYLIRTRADDGVRVYIDGKLVLDRWTLGDSKEDAVKVSISDQSTTNPDEKNVHWIEVQYYEASSQSNLEFFIQPLSSALDTNQWVGYLYPNKTLTGEPMIIGGKEAQTPILDLNFNWGTGQPQAKIPADGFSARFVKKAYFETGIYRIKTRANDGIRVYVDGALTIDSWTDKVNSADNESNITLGAGNHEIVVEYYDNTGVAELKVDLMNITSQNAKLVSAINLPVYRSYEELADYTKHLTYYNPSYTRYMELGYGDLVYLIEEKNYAAKIQTQDGSVGWVHKDYLENNLTEDLWLVKEARTLRSSASSSSSSLGTVTAGSRVYVLDQQTVPGTSYTEWYYIQTAAGQRGWIWGAITTSGNQGYNLIKYEFNKVGTTTNQVNIFTPLNAKANVTAEQINQFINYKTGGKTTNMTGMGYAYLIAQEQSGLNAIYLLAHSGLETGWGTSTIVKTKYNYYGIGAIDSKPAEGAYDYTTKEGGIVAGACWISSNYVIRSGDTDDVLPFYQPTIDNMRFDNSWHQYASDEAWAAKIGFFAQEFYNFIN
ncbi:SH3 domain-containing protein [Bacillus sp. DNRA2]|uniref:PA14 domain-containing protein n=1 Tax=Bacillus sp. DNRA2 TaxID=2723053 RepID=UPI00145E36CE|nr:PA14 domain-containing protein [Bacillus sp. DNRA2]NMD68806.1 SH3 domain-containing protein [Bacillus sp. DNRA2]